MLYTVEEFLALSTPSELQANARQITLADYEAAKAQLGDNWDQIVQLLTKQFQSDIDFVDGQLRCLLNFTPPTVDHPDEAGRPGACVGGRCYM